MEPGATATCEVHISPKARRHERATPEQNLYQLVATLRCAEVEGIYGSVRIDPAPKAYIDVDVNVMLGVLLGEKSIDNVK